MTEPTVLGSAAVSTSYNMLLQLIFRVLTFVLNAIILRYISKDMLGIVNVRLTLLYTTVLFISREAFRRACLTKASDTKWPQMINLLWTSIPISIAFSALLSYAWIYMLEAPDTIPYYSTSVLCFAASVVIEMMAEPLYVVAQVLLYVRMKVLVMGAALALRCVLTVTMVIFFPQYGLLSFAVAQVLHTVFYTSIYFAFFTYLILSDDKPSDFPFKSIHDILPQRPAKGECLFSHGLVQLTWSFFKQSFLKQILTEGERFIMTIFGVLNFGDQGVYDIVNNLGSLAARFIFLPLEEGAYLFFSQSLVRGKPATDQDKESMRLASHVLESLLKLVVLTGCVILVFGYSYSHLLLDLYGGHILSSGSGPSLLRWFSVYVLLLAVNGITESFCFSTMSQEQVDRYNLKMLAFSTLFLISSWYLTSLLGSVGFILANCLNMAARITHSLYYTQQFYTDSDQTPLSGLRPSLPLLLIFLITLISTAFSEAYLYYVEGWTYKLLHISVGTVFIIIIAITTYFTESNLVNFVKELIRDRHKAKKL